MSLRLDELAAAWAEWAGPRALQFAALATVVLVVDRALLRRAWPRPRLALHAVALLMLALPPLPAPAAAPWSALVQVAAPAAPDSPAAALLPAAFVAWLAVALILGAGMLVVHRRARVRALAADRGAPAELRARVAKLARSLRLRRTPEIVVLSALRSPAVVGAVRPLLAIPQSFAAAGRARELDHALVHELLHVKRGDMWAAAVARLVAVAWWFHPLAWVVARRAAALRELACDDDAVGWLRGSAHEYRSTLLEQARVFVAGEAPPRPRLAGAVGFLAAQSSIVARLEWLARPRTRRPRLERSATWLAAAALALAAWPTAAADHGGHRGARAPDSGATADESLRAAALDVVHAALSPQRPPGCLRLQNAVTYLARAGVVSPERAAN